VKAPASEAFAVECAWSDAELGSIPCAYGTAENMLHRARVTSDEHVVVTGASGGVASAVVQLAKRRGAAVTAVAGRAKTKRVRAIGADRVAERDDDIVVALGERSVDVVVDNVAGPAFGGLLDVPKRGGRYVSSGAIGGPIVTLDKRAFYLKDLTLIGCRAWDEPAFPNLISAIAAEEVRPLVAKTFPLERIADAQREFLEKRHVGNFVLIPPPPEGRDERPLRGGLVGMNSPAPPRGGPHCQAIIRRVAASHMCQRRPRLPIFHAGKRSLRRIIRHGRTASLLINRSIFVAILPQ